MTQFSVLFCGDFAPCRRFEAIVLERGGAVFGALRDEIAKVDLAFTNLEVPLCRKGRAIVKTGPNLRADPACVRALAEAGFQVAGLANNHIMDFGPEGLESTLAACAHYGLKTCGAGANTSAAARPLTLLHNGINAALIAVAEQEFNAAGDYTPGAAILDPIEISRQIAAIRPSIDLLLVTIHGGNEHFPFPRPGLRRLCRYLVDAGADGVICHHPHVAGAYEIYEGKPIVYSLGNLLFDADPAPHGWEEGYAAKLIFRDAERKGFRCEVELLPYKQSVQEGGVTLLAGAERDAFLARLDSYRSKLEDDDAWRAEWIAFCRQQRIRYIARQYIPFRFRGMGRLTRYLAIDRFFLPQWSINQRKNMLRCDSHRELLCEILEHE